MMMFETLLRISLIGAVLISLALLVARLLGQRMAAGHKRLIWLVLAVRLLVPVELSLPQAPVRVTVPDLTRPLAVATQTPVAPLAVSMPQQAAVAPSPLAIAYAVWVAGTLAYGAYQVIGHLHARRRMLRWHVQPDARTQAALDAMRAEMGIRRRVTLVRSKAVRTPMLLGLMRPLLVLPCADYDDADLALILRHELTHLRRGDLWYKLLMLTARTVHWFNPLAHVMARQAEVDMEYACDDAVLRGIGREQGRRYGETILAAASLGEGCSAALSTHFQSGRKHLARRILNLMYAKKRRIGVLALAFVMLAIMAGGAMIGFASVEPVDAQEDYAALLALRTPGYLDEPVATFDARVSAAFQDEDASLHALYKQAFLAGARPEGMDAEDWYFLQATLSNSLGGETPYAEHRSAYINDDIVIEAVFGHTTWEPDQLTVRQRDAGIASVSNGMADYLAGGGWSEGEEAVMARLAELCAMYTVEGLELTPLQVYYGMDAAEAEARGEAAYDTLQRLAQIDTALTVAEYAAQVEALCAERNTNVHEVMADVWEVLPEDGAEYTFLVGTLMHTSSEMFAAQMGGEERPYASGLARREKYITPEEDAQQLRGEMDDEEYEAFLEAVQGDPDVLVFFVQAAYNVLYDIADPTAITVAEREAAIAGVETGFRAYMDDLTDEKLAAPGLEADLRAVIERLAAQYSEDRIAMTGELTELARTGLGEEL